MTTRPRSCSVLAAGLVLWSLLPSAAAHACLAHYRTILQEVDDSPLIVIGKIEDVTWASTTKPDELFDRPTTAIVRVVRVLKGRWDGGPIKVLSGPVGSCAPWPVHCSFKQGNTDIFILPQMPVEGRVRMIYGGAHRPLSQLEDVENALAHARDYLAAFIAGAKKDRPQAFADAEKLDVRFAKERKKWPTPTTRPVEGFTITLGTGADPEEAYYREEDPPGLKGDIAGALAMLRETKIETIHLALAMDWPEGRWSKAFFWRRTCEELRKQRQADIAEFVREQTRERLRAIGVSKNDIDAYVATLDTEDLDQLVFPGPEPRIWGPKRTGEVLTTDFLSRFWGYDRGKMFPAYGMNFEALASLDPQRLKEIIPSMRGSHDGQIQNTANQAVGEIPGVDFLLDVLGDVCYGRPDAMWPIMHGPHAKSKCEWIAAHVEESGYYDFWLEVHKNKWYRREFIEGVIKSSEYWQKRLAQVESTSTDAQIVRPRIDVLYAYLRDAAFEQKVKLSAAPTIEEYRKAFAEAFATTQSEE